MRRQRRREYSHFWPPPLPLEKLPKPFPFKSLDVEAEEEVADVEAPQWRENDNAGARSSGT